MNKRRTNNVIQYPRGLLAETIPVCLSQLPRPTFTTRDGETEVDCPKHLLDDATALHVALRRNYVRGSSHEPDDGGLRLRESTVCGILAWAITEAIDDPVELTPAGLTYSRCFDLAVGLAKGTPADKMPEWMPVACILVRAHQL